MTVNNCSKDFVVALFEGLNTKKLRYAVGGDYNHLPESVGHDIDIWTDDVKTFREVLFSSITKTGHQVLIDNKTANGCNVAFYKRNGEMLTFMKIDVMTDTSWKSILTLIDKKTTADHILPYKNFYIINPEGEALGHFLYPMFEWGCIKKDIYKIDIKRHYQSEVFKTTFLYLWGEETSQEIFAMIKNDKWKELEKSMGRLKRKAILKGLLRKGTWRNAFRAAYHAGRRWIKPSGKCLAFCGLDGAGKTTILDELNHIFIDLLKKKKVFYGYWRPFIIPEIRELLGKKNSKDGIDLDAQKGKTIIEPKRNPKKKLISIVKLFYYWLDFMLAPFKYGGIRSRGGMVLFDRHYVDMVVHPQRFEMGISKKLMLILYKFIPKADYTFFLYCNPEEILQRKQEFTAKEISAQKEQYLEVGKCIKNFVPIHTNKTIAVEIDEILSHIANR